MSDPQVMQALADLVPRGSRVLDLGCGNGAFLSFLQTQRACTGYGVEIDDANVLACVQRGDIGGDDVDATVAVGEFGDGFAQCFRVAAVHGGHQ